MADFGLGMEKMVAIHLHRVQSLSVRPQRPTWLVSKTITMTVSIGSQVGHIVNVSRWFLILFFLKVVT